GRGIFEMEALVRSDEGMDRVRGGGGFGETGEDQLQLVPVRRDVADGEYAGRAGLAGRRVDVDMVAVELQPPLRGRHQIPSAAVAATAKPVRISFSLFRYVAISLMAHMPGALVSQVAGSTWIWLRSSCSPHCAIGPRFMARP